MKTIEEIKDKIKQNKIERNKMSRLKSDAISSHEHSHYHRKIAAISHQTIALEWVLSNK